MRHRAHRLDAVAEPVHDEVDVVARHEVDRRRAARPRDHPLGHPRRVPPVRLDERHAPELPRANELVHPPVLGEPALAVVDDEQPAPLRGQPRQLPRLAHGERERLLDEDVEPRLERGAHRLDVQEVRGRDVDGGELAAPGRPELVDHRPKVRVRPRRVALGDLAGARLVDVGDGDEPHVQELVEHARVARAEDAGANDGDAERGCGGHARE
jgi:hypothetical protein